MEAKSTVEASSGGEEGRGAEFHMHFESIFPVIDFPRLSHIHKKTRNCTQHENQKLKEKTFENAPSREEAHRCAPQSISIW